MEEYLKELRNCADLTDALFRMVQELRTMIDVINGLPYTEISKKLATQSAEYHLESLEQLLAREIKDGGLDAFFIPAPQVEAKP